MMFIITKTCVGRWGCEWVESESVCVNEWLSVREEETRAHSTERQWAQHTTERQMRESWKELKFEWSEDAWEKWGCEREFRTFRVCY